MKATKYCGISNIYVCWYYSDYCAIANHPAPTPAREPWSIEYKSFLTTV